MFRMLILPPSGACDLFDELFHGLFCSGSMCVGVTLWFGCGGVVSACIHPFLTWDSNPQSQQAERPQAYVLDGVANGTGVQGS